MDYIVINHFTDLYDNDHPYNVGDIYPREGYIAGKDRIKELSSADNKQCKPLIKAVVEKAADYGTDDHNRTARTNYKRTNSRVDG